jgi:hypothetical protein
LRTCSPDSFHSSYSAALSEIHEQRAESVVNTPHVSMLRGIDSEERCRATHFTSPLMAKAKLLLSQCASTREVSDHRVRCDAESLDGVTLQEEELGALKKLWLVNEKKIEAWGEEKHHLLASLRSGLRTPVWPEVRSRASKRFAVQ